MENTKLFDLISSFSSSELKSFQLWLQSPLHCGDQKLLAFFDLVFPLKKKKQASILTKEFIFKTIFGGKKFNEALLRNLISDLLICAENFIVWQKVKNNPAMKLHLLLEEYNERALPALFEMRFKPAAKALSDSDKSLFNQTLSAFLIDEEEFSFMFTQNAAARQKIFKEYNQEKILFSLTKLFLVRYLHYFLVGIDTEKSFGQNSLSRSENVRIVLNVSEKYFPDDVFIRLHTLLIRYLLKDETDEKKFKEKLLNDLRLPEFTALEEHDKRNCFTTCINIFLGTYTKGELQTLPLLTGLMESALENKSPVRNKIISTSFFINYIVFLLILEEEKKAELFFNEYSSMLEEKIKESTVNFARAHFCFHNKNYGQAQKHLSLAATDTPQRFLAAKNMLLKIYFQKKEWEMPEGIIDSIRHKLINDKFFSQRNILAEKNFLRFFTKLSSFVSEGKSFTPEDKNKLTAEIDSTDYVMQKHWLMSVLEKME